MVFNKTLNGYKKMKDKVTGFKENVISLAPDEGANFSLTTSSSRCSRSPKDALQQESK